MARALLNGLQFTGGEIPGWNIEQLGLGSPDVLGDHAAFALYDYDTIIMNPRSFSHFIFGAESEFSISENELADLKRKDNSLDLDTVFRRGERNKEMSQALERGTKVVWCIAPEKREKFFGTRSNYLGYAAPSVSDFVETSEVGWKKSVKVEIVDDGNPFKKYFEALRVHGWELFLREPAEGFISLASSLEGFSLGGKLELDKSAGWLITPPSNQAVANQLVLDALGAPPEDTINLYHGIFISHTGADKEFVRKLRDDLKAAGVERVWVDEAEIEIGDSLIQKIEEGLRESPFVAAVLSPRSVTAPWVQKELNSAMNREIKNRKVVVLPLLIEDCEIPTFLEDKLYGDFRSKEKYSASMDKLLRRLRVAR